MQRLKAPFVIAAAPLLLGLSCAADAGSSTSAKEGPQNFRVTVLGSPVVLSSISASNLALVSSHRSGSQPEDEYQGVAGSTWDTVFRLSASTRPGARHIDLRAWLCPAQALIPNELDTGQPSLESRTIELDDTGTFWTNGRLDYPFPSDCMYARGPRQIAEIAAYQDGPSLCTEAARSGTDVRLEDEVGGALSAPITCVAHYSADKRRVDMTLVHDEHGMPEKSFKLYLGYCLASTNKLPLEISADAFQVAGCAEGGEDFRLGDVSADAPAPAKMKLVSGTWQIQATGPDRGAHHVSEIDLLYAGPPANIRVRGHVDLPQDFE